MLYKTCLETVGKDIQRQESQDCLFYIKISIF
jgi:hypothetical protein